MPEVSPAAAAAAVVASVQPRNVFGGRNIVLAPAMLGTNWAGAENYFIIALTHKSELIAMSTNGKLRIDLYKTVDFPRVGSASMSQVWFSDRACVPRLTAATLQSKAMTRADRRVNTAAKRAIREFKGMDSKIKLYGTVYLGYSTDGGEQLALTIAEVEKLAAAIFSKKNFDPVSLHPNEASEAPEAPAAESRKREHPFEDMPTPIVFTKARPDTEEEEEEEKEVAKEAI